MGLIALKISALLGLLAPLTLALGALLRRYWRGAPPSEVLLGALLLTPIVLILEIVALGSLPWGRPLGLLPLLQTLLSGAAAWLCWRMRRELASHLAEAARGLGAVIRAAAFGPLLVLLLGVAALAAATVHGVWNAPSAWDELAYHVPQALQPYQDGRLGEVHCDAFWADTYPRGVTLLHYWTLAIAHTDAAFHAVNAAFGFVFVLATYVAARRMGLRAATATICAGLIPTAPAVLFMASIGYIDLSVGGATTAMIALALPQRDRGWSWGSALLCAAAAALTWWMKFLPIVCIGITFAYRALRLAVDRWRRPSRAPAADGEMAADRGGAPATPALAGAGGPGVFGWCAVALLGLAIGAAPYVRTHLKYGSPTYPVRMSLAGLVVFDGPMNPKAFGRMNDRPLLERYSIFWTSFREPQNTDSPGGFGIVFATVLIFSSLALLVSVLHRFELNWAFLAVLFWSALLLPEFHIPRYAMYILLPAVLGLGRLLESLDDAALRRGAAWALAALSAYGIALYADPVIVHVRWQCAQLESAATRHRNRPVIEDYALGGRGLDGPARRALYGLMRPGETLVFAIYDFHGLLYDRYYTYAVEFRPARRWPYAHNPFAKPRFGEEDAAAWLARIQRENVGAVIAYKGSIEDLTLASPDSRFGVAYEMDAREGVPAIRIHRRADP
ncbi:MAG: hypothetical protein LC135_10735 [Phycisphaerae bacterium]|nr:hypothetical protein [Phycisphaerae bacterium]MCZ2400325.1 hypothetical protein [Phycisphaerae bacterium]